MNPILAIILIIAAAIVGIVLGIVFYGLKDKDAKKRISAAEEEATRIVNEGIRKSESKTKEMLLEAKEEIHKSRTEYEKEVKERRAELSKQERRLEQKEATLDKKTEAFERKEEELAKKLQKVTETQAKADELCKAQMTKLEEISQLTQEQAKAYLLQSVEEEVRHEAAMKIKEIEAQLKDEADEKAREILSIAIQRCAADHVSEATSAIFDMLSRANKYIDETTPWILAKSEETKPRLATVIYNLLEAIRVGAVLLSPFIPSTCEEIFRELNTEFVNYSDVEFGKLESGKSVGESKILFNRIDEKAMLEQIEAERKAKEEAEKPIEKPEGCAIITIDKFAEVELRTAQIIACEKVPKAKKLLKLQVDLGYEKRQVVSGIAKFYEPEELIGKKVVVVANLAPATLCGIESNGMLLASGEETVRVIFLDKDTPNGERVR